MPTQIEIQPRQWPEQGYYLDTVGYHIGQAIRYVDICIPSEREELINQKRRLITRSNGSTNARDHRNEPPSLDTCSLVLDEIAARRQDGISHFNREIAEMKNEIKDASLGRDERSFLRARLKDMETRRTQLELEADITPEDLHNWFRVEAIQLRAKFVPEEIRAALDIMAQEREIMHLMGSALPEGMSDGFSKPEDASLSGAPFEPTGAV